MNRWLARLAMSFFVIAAVLVWEAYKLGTNFGPSWRITVYLVAAGLSVVLGAAGTREKHRLMRSRRED
jgi:hypothetical protein